MNSKKFYLIIISLFLLVLFLFIYFLVEDLNFKVFENFEERIVTKIIDGDTIILNNGEKIRFLGIDCDERGKKCYQEAKERLEETLLEKNIFLEKYGKDLYGRTLGYIFLNETNINLQMVGEGYCIARFEDDLRYKKEIIEAEKFAIENRIGCKWS